MTTTALHVELSITDSSTSDAIPTTQKGERTNEVVVEPHNINKKKKKIPIYLMAGFLGAGKTTVLQQLLHNTADYRLGIIVNDVAAMNIDAKLIQRTSSSNSAQSSTNSNTNTNNGIVELQNGCACCSLADELFTSIERLLQMKLEQPIQTDNKEKINDDEEDVSSSSSWDAIIVELSGVADPVAIQNNWIQASRQRFNPTVTDTTDLYHVITVVDATTFGSDYMTYDTAIDRPTWFGISSDNDPAAATLQQMDCTVHRKVVELLTEQIEAANIVVLNKIDMATTEQVQIAQEMIQSLVVDDNTVVPIIPTSYGNITTISQLLPHLLKSPRTKDDDDDNHRHHDNMETTTTTTTITSEAACADSATTCTDPTHDHSSHSHHDHHHDTTTTTASTTCEDTTCTDPIHSHSHSHHEHHDTSTIASESCVDTTCTDPTHDHSHSHHEHHSEDTTTTMPSSSSSTSTDNLGITNFVYQATRPFSAHRLMQLLYQWPVPIKDELDLSLMQEAVESGYNITSDAKHANDTETSPFVGVLRSKGFCWMAPVSWRHHPDDAAMDTANSNDDDSWRHDIAMYWSHAGRHIGITEAGRWWHSLCRNNDTSMMREFFAHNPDECERVLRQDFVTTEFGDRRQELVFIGVGLRETNIRTAPNDCLLTDAEMDVYRAHVQRIIEVVDVVS